MLAHIPTDRFWAEKMYNKRTFDSRYKIIKYVFCIEFTIVDLNGAQCACMLMFQCKQLDKISTRESTSSSSSSKYLVCGAPSVNILDPMDDVLQ